MEYNYSEFLIETKVPKNEIIVSRTSLDGTITYANEAFAQISDYKINELIGKPHSILRHPDMPKAVFLELWQSLEEKGKWCGVIKNLRKDKGFYWVYAEVSAVFKDGKIHEYKSVRIPISYEDKKKYQNRYDYMKNATGEYKRKIIYELS